MKICRVPFDWKYNGSALKRARSVLCSPTTGTLAAGAKQVVNLKIVAGIPDRVNEVIYFEVAHFEPVAVNIKVDGMYSSVALSIPRVPSSYTPEKLAAAADTLLTKGSVLMDMISQKDQKVLKKIQGAPSGVIPFLHSDMPSKLLQPSAIVTASKSGF
jgi:hypothetical protein